MHQNYFFLSAAVLACLLVSAHCTIFLTAAAATGTVAAGTVVVPGAAVVLAAVGALAFAGFAAAAILASQNGKRSVNCLPFDNPDVFLTLAVNSDSLGCGMRLVCELEATADEVLSKEEKLILGLFGRSPQAVSFSELGSPKSSFQYAAFVGANAKNISDCAKFFDKCPFDRKTMIDAFQEANSFNNNAEIQA